jgi:3',5'-cyclic AMP phosphodiesterase CpdA
LRFARYHAPMFALAHLSDPHLPLPQPHWRELAGKRVLGFLNWRRKRQVIHRMGVLADLVRDLRARAYDHLAVTGDLVNISLAAEFAPARAWLAALGPPADVTLVPGNHDIYVRAALCWPSDHWGDYMRGDDGAAGFPFLRRRGDVALIGLSSALPTAPFLATGRLGEEQLRRLAEMLAQLPGQFRIVLIHHPPLSAHARHKRLIDAASLRGVLAQRGAELVLHGHDHVNALAWLDGPEGRIPAVGVASASSSGAHGSEPGAWNLYRIDGRPGAWRCEMVTRGRGADGTMREVARRTLI